MTIRKAFFIALMALPVTFSVDAHGQMTSTNYALPHGEFVGGGGASSSTGSAVIGRLSRGPVGVSTSGTSTISGGLSAAGGASASHMPAAAAVPKVNYPLRVIVSGSTGGNTGQIFWRYGGQVSYNSPTNLIVNGDTLTYTVPAANLTNRGYEYYFSVQAGGQAFGLGSPNAPYRLRVRLTDAQNLRTSATPVSLYRIVGVPSDSLPDSTVTGIFGDDLGAKDIKQWRLGSYDRTQDSVIEYPNAVNWMPGQAYWLITRVASRYASAGQSAWPNYFDGSDQYYEVPLDSGWNMVANPLAFDVDWSEVRFDTGGVLIPHDNNVVEDSAYWYDGTQYQTVADIPDWDGVFLNSKVNGAKVLFLYHEANATVKPRHEQRLTPDVASDGWTVHLVLTGNGKRDAGNFIGVRSDASPGVDRYDYADPPTAPEGIRLALRLPEGESGLRRTDYRPTFDDGANWNLVFSNAIDRQFTAYGLGQVPAGMEARLILDNGLVFALEEGVSITLPPDAQEAQLVIGGEAYRAEHESAVQPTQFALDQNYPNPFNPETRIRFALPVETSVRVVIYNALGQQVRVLADGSYPAGTFDVIWDGQNEQGGVVASGVYFYRLEADEFTATQKMILLR